jgi:aminoglycoside 3-N-acetyltransferase I
MTLNIRQLTPHDIPLMRDVLRLFSDAFEDVPTYTKAPPRDQYLETLLARDTFIALAAVVGGKVIGALTAYQLDKYEQERSEIYIYDLAVDTAYRRQGVATALIQRISDIATDRSAWVIFVQADYGDDPAVALYTKLGTRDDVMHFDIAVSVKRNHLRRL